MCTYLDLTIVRSQKLNVLVFEKNPYYSLWTSITSLWTVRTAYAITCCCCGCHNCIPTALVLLPLRSGGVRCSTPQFHTNLTDRACGIRRDLSILYQWIFVNLTLDYLDFKYSNTSDKYWTSSTVDVLIFHFGKLFDSEDGVNAMPTCSYLSSLQFVLFLPLFNHVN